MSTIALYITKNKETRIEGISDFFIGFCKDYNKGGKLHNLVFLSSDIDTPEECTVKLDSFSLLSLSKLMLVKQIKLVLFPEYNESQYELVQSLNKLPAFLRPKIVCFVSDPLISKYYLKGGKVFNYAADFGQLFKDGNLDAVITWFEDFKVLNSEKKILGDKTTVYMIGSSYASEYYTIPISKKLNNIVFTAPFTEASNPLLFLEAITLIRDSGSIKGWHFYLHGKGEMENEIKYFISQNSLSKLVSIPSNYNLKEVLVNSKCLVAPWEYDKSGSPVIHEAMLTGNAIITSRNGNAEKILTENNTLFLRENSAKSIAESILKYIDMPETEKRKMYNESMHLAAKVHTLEKFKQQMESAMTSIVNS